MPAAAATVDHDAIAASAVRIAPYVRRTPVIDALCAGASASFKLESLQVGGSFKARGAFNRLLSNPMPEPGVVAASGGNHGIAVALAAAALGAPANVFVPGVTSAAKIARLQALGAQVHRIGDLYADALAASMEFAEREGALRAHAYDQTEIVCGQGTVAVEWEAQAPDLDTVLVAVGGGGLIGGIAAWYRDRVRVVGVETEGCPTLARALAAGEIVDVEVGGLAADALGARRVGEIMFPIARRHVDRSVLVSDDAVRAAQRWLWDALRLATEPGGATAAAALLGGAYRPEPGERVGVLVCGANVDLASLAATVQAPVDKSPERRPSP
ncbi:MAG: threonine/serine dehydratase [Burkholderiales bacterium]|nr:MAG: threonine/serine dehydratase [Burkholderiales bacterium]